MTEAQAAADVAITQVGKSNAMWLMSAMFVAVKFMKDRASSAGMRSSDAEFTTDDLWKALGDLRPIEPRAMGALMRALSLHGHCRNTGRVRKSSRTSCHARPLAIWEAIVR